jgi:hypothetical protein
VDSHRGHVPYVVREELFPFMISYINQDRDIPPSRCESFHVHRVRTRRFLLKTRDHKTVQAEITFGIFLWDEDRHDHMEAESRHTWIEIKMFRKIKNCNGTYYWRKLFENFHSDYDAPAAEYELEGYDDQPLDPALYHDDSDSECEDIHHIWESHEIPISVEHNLRQCTRYIYICFEFISRAPKYYNFPNIHFLIAKGLPAVLHKYLPEEFVLDTQQALIEPKADALWMYRVPPSPELRRRFLQASQNHRDHHGQLTKEFFIYEVPWYRDWYPKPVELDPKNLLPSLPVHIIGGSILPFLTHDDVASLVVVCPALVASNKKK